MLNMETLLNTIYLGLFYASMNCSKSISASNSESLKLEDDRLIHHISISIYHLSQKTWITNVQYATPALLLTGLPIIPHAAPL